MKREQLQVLLGSLSGHLQARTPREEKNIEKLNDFFLRSLLTEDVRQLKGSSFAFESADLFSVESIPPSRLRALQTLVQKKIESGAEPEFRAFAREVPVRSTQLHASTPLWAGGAAVETTIGPFTGKDGRQFWFDFFLIQKLVALYIQNRPNPALLFKVRSGAHFISPHLPLTVQPATSYRLPAGSIWINSEILAANSPAGYYTGLTIRGGVITLSAPPQTINGKLTVSPNTVVTVRLELQQQAVNNADPTSPYGVDARDASVQLPDRLAFRFSGAAGRTLDEISNAEWEIFGQHASFAWDQPRQPVFDNLVHRVLIPFRCSDERFRINSCKSPFHTIRESTRIKRSAWALPAAPIDIVHPTPAAGIGAMLIQGEKGLTNKWTGLKDGELGLTQPYVMAEPGRISISDPTANNLSAHQNFHLWKDDLNEYGTSVGMAYPKTTPFFYFTFADGNEALMVPGNADVKIDRPVTVVGEAVPIHSKNSLLILSANKTVRLITLFDDNIFVDSVDFTTKPPTYPKPIALAIHNALFKVTSVNGCVLFGALADDFIKVTPGFLYLTFGLHAYVPTLPDPYAANLKDLREQFRPVKLTDTLSIDSPVWLWLACRVTWQPTNLPANNPDDEVQVSFNFAPLQNQFQALSETSTAAEANTSLSLVHPLVRSTTRLSTSVIGSDIALSQPQADAPIQGEIEERDAKDDPSKPLDNYVDIWDQHTRFLQQDTFALLDVSTNADLLGVSFGVFGRRQMLMFRTHGVTPAQEPTFPLQVKGMDVVSQGINVRAFTVPQISWEPVFNLSPKMVQGDPKGGFNYYPDDGGPARILNFSGEQVALAPIPLTDYLVDSYATDDKFAVLALFTLPFGMKSLAWLQKKFTSDNVDQKGNDLRLDPKSFEDDLEGARQLELIAGNSPIQGESNLFPGSTIQLNNVLEWDGSYLGASTLGRSVTRIFNFEFMPSSTVIRPRGVPVTRIDLSGYGASMFSNWLNPKATIAATSQAKFDVFVGRCAHEVIQVKSIMYPWGIRVVRTITLQRTSTNYVFRHDSGWKAESDGKFDFSYYANKQVAPGAPLIPVPRNSPYDIHPGVVLALYNAKEIKETDDIKVFKGTGNLVLPDNTYVDSELGLERTFPADTKNLPTEYELQPVYFNADVEIENPVSGFVTKEINGQPKKLVPSKGILGFVQLAPRGMPIPPEIFKQLIASQQGSIGGPIDTLVNIAASNQQIRLNRFDVNNSFAENGIKPIFVAAGRGNVILPKDGSWSLVKHESGAGTVSPVPEDLSVPLIRVGKLVKPKPLLLPVMFTRPDLVDLRKRDGELVVEPKPTDSLVRIANPTELLRPPVPTTINYGFLHSTDTQKCLYLTPAFKLDHKELLSKTPPLFADAFRLVNSKAIFPNIKDAVTSFGEAIALIKKQGTTVDQFEKDVVTGALRLMQIDNLGQQGYKLLKQPDAPFPLPDHWDLINIGGSFRIYIQYKAGTHGGNLNYDVNSFAPTLADTWKSRMANVSLVVNLGPFEPLMTIMGNWDAKKGSEAAFGGRASDAIPRPQIVFAKELEPVLEILEILEKLSGNNYAGAVGQGVRLAMSNKAGAWEYKFEAVKEIPLLRFPPGLLYDNPTNPFKLEAGLRLGAYFNSALQIPTDKNQLLPSAGAFFGFFGRLSVMCVSLAAATIYAVGQANLDFGADTKKGFFLRMKFGFGAQIVVGLPVILNVSVLYVVGVEIYLDKQQLQVSAFMLFQGHADILGGLVSVTITIEAKGTVERHFLPGDKTRTNLAAQVNFALEITVFWIIDITISESWGEDRQLAGTEFLID